MLALVQAAELHGEPFLGDARRACEYWSISRTQPIPDSHQEWHRDGKDPCAAIIAAIAIAMLGLANQPGQSGVWRTRAESILAAVVRSRYFVSEGDLAGVFAGMRYRTRGGEERVESACSRFFLLSLLLTVEGRIGALEL